ncbi:target of EGR1 protein 1 [Aplochiton taeniatus]
MTSSMVVPVIDVQNDNFRELWPSMVLAIKTSSFIAVDTELSGLGSRKALLAESIEDRYKAICHAARTRSVLSLGIACYKKPEDKPADSYQVQVYNLTLLCSEEYVIEPQSVKFLVEHGFDFNKQYAQGVSYCKGNTKEGERHGVSIRSLFTELLRSRKPLALHNGLIDMAFLYQCFYAHLPERLATFTADLSQMFPAGVYDTKYVTEYELRLQASYLEYAYKKCKLDNQHGVETGVKGQLHLEFCTYSPSMARYVDYRACLAGTIPDGSQDVCTRFSAFGWCPNGTACLQSHDTDLIIQQDDQIKQSKTEKRKQRKRKRKNMKEGGEGAQANGASIFDGAPENKMANKEPDETHGQGTSGETDPGTMLVSGGADEGEPSQTTSLSQSAGSGAKAEGDGAMETQTAPPPPPPPPTSTTAVADPAKMAAKKKKQEGGTHRAGFDAFMTGYIFAFATLSKRGGGGGGGGGGGEGKEKEKEEWLPSCLNKIYLSGKSTPLNIVKSTFSRSSKAHCLNMDLVWGKTAASALLEQPHKEAV